MAAFNNSCTPEMVFDVLLPGWKPPGKEGFGWRLFSRAKLTITCLRTSVRDSRLLLCCGSVMLTNVKSCSCWAASPTPGRDPCKRCGARLASVLVVQLACEMTLGTKVARLRFCDSPLSGPLGASGLYRDWPLAVPEVGDDGEVSSSGKCWPERLSPIAWSMCARGVRHNS
jgi:hypothetical protein